MNLKSLFKQLFPDKQEFQIYLKWREHRKQELNRQRSIRKQQQERQGELLAMDDDPEDEEYDPISADVWQEVMG